MVSKEKMNEIYKRIKTPYKHGAILKYEDAWVDSPTVFKFDNRFYMYYVKISKDISKSGYETHISSSEDLLNWKYEGTILERTDDDSWDSKQKGGYAAFVDSNFGGTNEIQKINGKYYMSYLGGCLNGYETDPLSMGMAYSEDPSKPGSFTTFKKPILTSLDDDVREFETKTLFKSYMFSDEAMTLGHKYVNAYNAKPEDDKERIYLAVSDDGEKWERYGREPIINEVDTIKDLIISGDPQIVKIGDIYVMFFFRCMKDSGAYNTFACSYDLVDWTIWDGEPLIKSEYEWENRHAHKSFVLMENDVVYHYYCATNDKRERFIALATNKKLG